MYSNGVPNYLVALWGVCFDFGIRVGLVVLSMIKDFDGVCSFILVV